MWYELLPFMGICIGVAGGVQFFHMPFNYFTEKGPTRPYMFSRHKMDNYGFVRDRLLTGSRYRGQGLEAIPDEE